MTQLVLPGTPGRRVVIRQRRVELPPFTNCRLVDAVRMLVFAGVRVPDQDRLVRVLRRATGVPEVGPDGPQGTSAADLIRAFGIVLPWIPIEARLWSDAELLDSLAAGEVAVSVAVPVYNGLPGDLARWSPRFGGGHMIGLARARPGNVRSEVLWVDGLGLPPYRGEWVRWDRVKPHLSQAGGRVFATTIERGAALSTSIVLQRAYPAGTTATVRKNADTFAYDGERMTFAAAKPAGAASRPLIDTQVLVDQQPRSSARPHGRFVRVAEGPLSGRYLRLADVTVAEPLVGDPVDVDAIRAAAFAEGHDAGEAEALERFMVVDEPLYRQVVGTVS